MKAIMGFAFFLLFLAGIALVMLQGREMARQNMAGGGSGITGQKWRPVLLGAESLADDSGMYVIFEVDGSIKGEGGCNSFSGSLQSTADSISVGPLGMTRKACERRIAQREDLFLRAIQDMTHFEAGAGRLQILDGENVLLAELVLAD